MSKETSAFWKGAGIGLLTPVLVASGAAAGAFPIMIALGVWHHEIDPRVPALGFWPVLGLSWGFGALVSKVRAKYQFGDKTKVG